MVGRRLGEIDVLRDGDFIRRRHDGNRAWLRLRADFAIGDALEIATIEQATGRGAVRTAFARVVACEVFASIVKPSSAFHAERDLQLGRHGNVDDLPRHRPAPLRDCRGRVLRFEHRHHREDLASGLSFLQLQTLPGEESREVNAPVE